MLVFLSVATIIGKSGLVGDLGIAFSERNHYAFGYVAYIYMPFLLYPLYRFYKDSHFTFRRLELIVAGSLFFVALLILQSLMFDKGVFGNALVKLLKGYIGDFGVWVLDIFCLLFAYLIASKRNIDLLLSRLKHKIFVLADIVWHYTRLCLGALKRFFSFLRAKIPMWLDKLPKRNIFELQKQNLNSILDLQMPTQELTQGARYDFNDVLIEQAFDEMRRNILPKAQTQSQTDLINPAESIAPIPPQMPHSQLTPMRESQMPKSNEMPQAIINPAPQEPKIELVEATSSSNIEEFFKSQIAKHQALLANLKKRENSINQNSNGIVEITNTPQDSIKATNATTESTDSKKAQTHINPATIGSTHSAPISTVPHTQNAPESSEFNATHSIPTPPPRPLNPNAFLPTKSREEQLISSENQKANYSRQNAPESQNIESQKNAQSALSQPQDNLYTQMPQWMPMRSQNSPTQVNTQALPQENTQTQINAQTTQTPQARDSQNTQATQNPQTQQNPQAQNIQKQDSQPTPAHSAQATQPAKDLEPKTAQATQPAQPQPKEADFIDIREIPSENEKSTKSQSWADSIIQEITPPQPAQAPRKSTPHIPRVMEIAENMALLNSLDYGKSQHISHFKLPSTSLLHQPIEEQAQVDENEIDRKIEDLLAKLRMFRVEGDVVRFYSGPVVTMFEFRPAPHIKVSKILNLEDDLAMALRARSIRIQAPVPGKDVIGIEIPNNAMQTIYLREILESSSFKDAKSPLTLALGKDIVGMPFAQDLKQFPHLLIAGTTGSGKSVGINAMILSLLFKNPPERLKLLMIDPKKVEFSIYADIPHLITPIITQSKKAITALNSAMVEMERRYDLIGEMRSKEIDTYNAKALESGAEVLPYLVIVIDELADLMMTGGKEVEFALARIAQMGRASGIHIIAATQRPSVDVVTGLIKTNIPTRISYKVSSKVDSRVILDSFGAESLLGKGDMLFTPPSIGGIIRLHAPWNTEDEIEKVVSFIKSQQAVEYDKSFMIDENEALTAENIEDGDILAEAKRIFLQEKRASGSLLQRKLGIGYNKAANIVEQLEKEGFLSAPNAKKEREILG